MRSIYRIENPKRMRGHLFLVVSNLIQRVLKKHYSLGFNQITGRNINFGISPKPHRWWIILLFWPASFFQRGALLLMAYFLAHPEIPPFSLKHHRTFSGGSCQPSTYLNAWTHRLFCRGAWPTIFLPLATARTSSRQALSVAP
jgi:hypothetical protein